MGVIKQGILGGFSGSVGGVVGSAWKGIAVIKSKPLSVANPNTAGQITNRTAFSLASKIGSLILADWIKPFWDRFASKMSGYNSWVQSNVEFMLNGSIGDYASLIMSVGKLSAASSVTAVADASASTLVITAPSPTLNQFSAASDIAVAVVYNASEDTWTVTGDLGNRGASPYTVTGMPFTTGDEVHVWISFKRADLSYVSNSAYDETVAVA